MGPEQTRAVQRVALEEMRLGIPLLFAMDVSHGHRTVFPLPLAEAGAFDPRRGGLRREVSRRRR
ncbi:MAG: hypothetical protein ACREJ0_04050 [Geminicoccaceae bacterium]